MNMDSTNPSESIKIGHNWRVIFTGLPLILIRFMFGLIYIVVDIKMFAIVSQSYNFGPLIFLILSLAFLSFIGMTLVQFYIIWLRIWYVFFGYLCISPLGIEYRYGPTYAIRCAWEDIDRKGKDRSFALVFPYDILYAKRAERLSPQFILFLSQKLGLNRQIKIPLTPFQGWPKGRLEQHLQRYLPEIIK